MSLTTYGWLVLIFPLAGCVLIGLTFRVLPGKLHGWLGTLAILLSFLSAVGMWASLRDRAEEERQVVSVAWDYAHTLGVDAQASILIDPLSTLMCLVVAGVSTLIHLYSVAYMGGDRGYSRFFGLLNFFVFAMLLLVLAGNFFLVIVGWAFVAMASTFLISFWYRRTTATRAGVKAFIIQVIGDVGLVLGAFFVFKGTGTLDYLKAFDAVEKSFSVNQPELVAACILFLVGAIAKSAQVPLHTWLPDAMEGPTPVSALIHAATMVTAGVYLIARAHPLFELAPTAADVGAFVGLATLIIAATIALVVTDLKRIIAYSTMSQIGYMVVGVSIGAYSAGLFHLMTHAFFKALLFMAAGSIIAAMANEQNIDKMSGFGKAMRFTSITMLCGGLALAAFPGSSGFFSKDEILAYAHARGGMYEIFEILGYVGALLTAVYTFRLIFRILPGKPCKEAQELIDTGHVAHEQPRNPATGEAEDTEVGFPGAEHHIAEQSWSMRAAMAVLAFLALFGGLVQVPGVDDMIGNFLEPVFEGSPLAAIHPSTGAEWTGLAIGAAISLLGIGIAYYCYVLRPEVPALLIRRLRPVHTLLVNKWYFDEAIDLLVVRPVLAVGRFANRTFERVVVDGLVSGTRETVGGAGGLVRVLQSGFVRAYALLLVAGFAGLALYFLIVST
jgi:NADH-quinone oxidoreductase subunit L